MKLCTSCTESLQIAILLLSCSVTVLCQKLVIGIEGEPITLPCSYKVRRSSDLTSMCWGRGSCPNSKCNQQLIWTDGRQVTFQSSSRYQLNDKIKQGIVSLTIVQASFEDAGTYCCRIEHQGWFNDEKINIKLTVEKAPTTTRTTTTARTTLKTTTPPPVQTTPEPFNVWTSPLTTSVEVTTQPPPTVASNTSPLSPVIRTHTPPSSTARTITSSPNVSPSGTTEPTDLTPRSSEFPTVITGKETPEAKPTSDETSSTTYHERITSAESKTEVNEHTSPSLWPKSLSPNYNGISDLFQGNITAPVKKDKSTIIVAISLSLIALIVICVILLQLRGQKRGHYLLGMDPRLELVTHAENPMTELQAEAIDADRTEEDKAATNHIGNTS